MGQAKHVEDTLGVYPWAGYGTAMDGREQLQGEWSGIEQAKHVEDSLGVSIVHVCATYVIPTCHLTQTHLHHHCLCIGDIQ